MLQVLQLQAAAPLLLCQTRQELRKLGLRGGANPVPCDVAIIAQISDQL
jgi:hypothetical protein